MGHNSGHSMYGPLGAGSAWWQHGSSHTHSGGRFEIQAVSLGFMLCDEGSTSLHKGLMFEHPYGPALVEDDLAAVNALENV